MATGYLTLFDVSGNGLGMASAATSITTENRSLTVGSGTLTAATGTFTNMGGTLSTVSQPNVTTLGGVTSLNSITVGAGTLASLSSVSSAYITTAPTVSNSKTFYAAGTIGTREALLTGNDLVVLYGATLMKAPASVTTDNAAFLGFIPRFDISNTNAIITRACGIYIDPGVLAGPGSGSSITTGYGLYVGNPVYGTTAICAYFEGDVYAGTTTAPTLSSRLVLSSSTQNSARLTLSGQEFFAPGTSSTDGVGLLIGVNRTNNRQLWIVDTANASAASTTNYTVRIATGNVAAIDAISTDGATTQTLSISRASITFPTTGGSAATLNYYEENSSLSLTFTGIWASDQTVTGKLVRIGTVVTLSIPDAYATANTSAAISLTGGTVLPSRYRPTADRTYPAILFDNGSNVAGSVVVRNTGQVNFYKTIAYGAFTGSGTSGILSLVLQWLIL